MSEKSKRIGYDFYAGLKTPKYIVAPMVDGSELPWRSLSRKHGAQLTYTPMIHAECFVNHPKYRDEVFSTCESDRPLIVQFCANDPHILLQAALLVQDACDGVDINLGCPQGIAKKGHYGCFLQDEWDLVSSMVRILHERLSVPVTCKIRVFDDVEKTIQYAKMIQESGCQLLTVHGRNRDQKGMDTGIADWTKIKAVKEALTIPVFANGNILYFDDIQKCMDATGVDGVMTAETNLYNPGLFTNKHYTCYRLAQEYLELAQVEKGAHLGILKGHIFKIFHPCLPYFPGIRDRLANVHSIDDLIEITHDLKVILMEMGGTHIVDGEYVGPVTIDENGYQILPMYVAQPYVRNLKESDPIPLIPFNEVSLKRKHSTENPRKIKCKVVKPKPAKCLQCSNASSNSCSLSLCKHCCHKNGPALALTRSDLVLTVNGSRSYFCQSHRSVLKSVIAQELVNG